MNQPKLSVPEVKVLKAFVESNAGSNKVISSMTDYTENTVRNHLQNIRAKYGVENRTQLFVRIQYGK